MRVERLVSLEVYLIVLIAFPTLGPADTLARDVAA